MKLFEYLGKEIFRRYGIPVPQGEVGATPEEVAKAVTNLGKPAVLKAQVLAGKRGKAGAIKFPGDAGEARELAAGLLGKEVGGFPVEKILVEEKLAIEQELYLAVTFDYGARTALILASAAGGMDIEEVPEEKIIRRRVDPTVGVNPYVGREVAYRLGFRGTLSRQLADFVVRLYRLFTELDAELVEINPLVVSDGKLIAADAKVTIDDEALYRHPELPRIEEKTSLEKVAYDAGLAYVELGGDIAVMANGAGITMATLDTIQYFGGSPASFLDAGGGASMEQNAKALEILLSSNPKVILINIFGGITRCDDVANAFVKIKKSREISVPVVIRLVGTNEEEGLQILNAEGISAYKSMGKAAQEAVMRAKA